MPNGTDDFPIEWENPAHAELPWQNAPVHWTGAVRQLDFDLASKQPGSRIGMRRVKWDLRKRSFARSSSSVPPTRL